MDSINFHTGGYCARCLRITKDCNCLETFFKIQNNINMKHIVILNGTARSGKDTFYELFKNYIDNNYFNIVNINKISSIDFINKFLISLGWNGEKTKEYRNTVVAIKQALIDFNDAPMKYIIKTYNNHNGILFVDIREPEEIKKLQELIGVNNITVVVIERLNNDLNENVTKVDTIENIRKICDYSIHNNGTINDLNKYCENLYKFIFEKCNN